MRVLVCGGRSYADQKTLNRVLDELTPHPTVIIHGGAGGWDGSLRQYVGADVLSGLWARTRGIEVLIFKARWAAYGRAAGPIRNQRMLEEGKPDLIVAFPGGRGTADMVRRAKKAGVKVIEVA